MTPPETQLKKLADIVKMMDEQVSKADFIKSFEAVLRMVTELKNATAREMTVMHKKMTEITDKMQSEKMMIDYCMKEMDKTMKGHVKMMKEQENTLNFVRDSMRGIKNGKDADETKIVNDVLAKIPKHEEMSAEMMRDMLENMNDKLSIQAIDGLSQLLERIEVKATGRVTGGLISKRIRFIDDETPTGTVNGSNKEFTLVSKSPETGSLKVYVNGQRQRVTTDYTLSNKTITFIIAPPTDSIILCDYRY